MWSAVFLQMNQIFRAHKAYYFLLRTVTRGTLINQSSCCIIAETYRWRMCFSSSPSSFALYLFINRTFFFPPGMWPALFRQETSQPTFWPLPTGAHLSNTGTPAHSYDRHACSCVFFEIWDPVFFSLVHSFSVFGSSCQSVLIVLPHVFVPVVAWRTPVKRGPWETHSQIRQRLKEVPSSQLQSDCMPLNPWQYTVIT